MADGLIGGNDVFVDIGDKSWGVLCCQNFLGWIEGGKTLHVGDQFLSAGANDFKVSDNLTMLLQDGHANKWVGKASVHHSMDSEPSGDCATTRRT